MLMIYQLTQIHINIFEMPSQEYTPTINADGNLYLPDFGEIFVGHKTLDSAKILIIKGIQKNLKGMKTIHIHLRSLKRVTVSVSGMVELPGSIQLSGNMRLLDAIKLANHGQIPSSKIADLRHIECKCGGRTQVFDLLRFITTQDLANNPYVYPGDAYFVPPNSSSLIVMGEFAAPIENSIAFKEGETLAELLDVLRLKSSADTDHIYIRHHGKNGTLTVVDRDSAKKLILAPNDIIAIPSKLESNSIDTIVAVGELMRPGTYPFVRGKTTAKDIIELAGGTTDIGNIKSTFIIKATSFLKSESPNEDPNSPQRSIQGLSRKLLLPTETIVRPEMNSGLGHLLSSRDFQYLDLKGRPEQFIVESGDKLIVPKQEHYVFVSGSVRSPGAIPFRKNASAFDYITEAGGFISNADRANSYLLSFSGDLTRIKPLDALLAGDIIVVPATIEYKRLTMIYLPLVQVAATILSLAFSFYALSRTN
jgi:protein involved in polysaccharide export with SLBB domain